MNTLSPPGSKRQILDAVLLGLFVCDGITAPGLPGGIPVSELAAAALVGLAFFRSPTQVIGSVSWLAPLALLLMSYLILGSMHNEADWVRRAVHLAIMCGVLWALTTGRVDIELALKGIAFALILNALLFYAGLAPDKYAGYLTGYLGDKNVAGLYYTIFPLLIMATLKKKNHLILCIAIGGVAIFLTGSRTSMAAYAAALFWIVLSRKLGKWARGALLVGLILTLQYLEDNFARAWIFSDRDGTDALRDRIGEAASEKTEAAPWYGLGLGEARVSEEDGNWLFHDSYLALLVEGGVVMLILVVGIYAWFGFQPFTRQKRSLRNLSLEAATIALLFCATKLGDVFLTQPGFILIACGMITSASIPLSRTARKLVGGPAR